MALSKDEFVRRSNIIHENKYDYSNFNYVNWDTKSIIICPSHGEFLQKPRQHIERKSGCKLCGHKKQANKKSISRDEFINRAVKVHGTKHNYDYLEYTGFIQPASLVCVVHGKFLFKYAYAHIINGTGCPKCARESHRSTTEDFIKKSSQLFPSLFTYEVTEYITVDTPLTITCIFHGYQHITPIDHYRIGCRMCKYNRMQDLWLNDMDIPNNKDNRQVRLWIDNILHIVDGFDKNTNTIYLFHGDYWHGNPNIYNSLDVNKRNGKTFGELYQQTLDYENRLKNVGYNVISIWEQEWIQNNIVKSVEDC
ncbi:MAG: DUF723 domain-containing protein [Hydrotalea sp. AMD]|uniref:DUF723 domain-containing protein n=1 Tax=Hydrotalea sp. AMD TaxID=2501297 RepID=UPI001024D5A2|nr:DUF723 domain-containing protein [Hydrotalea sp. AMD]RWZ87244.1 MAG: DUF723 domain-containing protein [Hydrotalea sp. AMD]